MATALSRAFVAPCLPCLTTPQTATPPSVQSGLFPPKGRHRGPGGRRVVAQASPYEDDDPSWVDDGSTGAGQGIFGFVNNNPSSRGAIQLENTPAQDYNVGQMIAEIEGKGREYGRLVEAGGYRWWVRELGAENTDKPPLLLLHGVPSASWSFKALMEQMASNGYRVIAPDWLGFGFSDKPGPKYEYDYTEEAYHQSLDELLTALDLDQPLHLVAHGFVTGQYALTWALKNADRIARLAILNMPLTGSAGLPLPLSQLRMPFVGEFSSQNAMLAERFIEKGSPYVLGLDDADIYRLPYLDRADAGFALLEVMRQAPVKELPDRIKAGFASGRWVKPVLVVWGEQDKYLQQSEATQFADINPVAISVKMIAGAGHQPHDDWPEKVVEALTAFLRRA